jgi:hypothetical protein
MPHPSLSPHLNIDALPFMRMNEIFGCVETLGSRSNADEFAGSFLLAIGRVVVNSLRRLRVVNRVPRLQHWKAMWRRYKTG